jgi:hypothetical protein
MPNYVSDQIDFYKGNSSLGGLQGSPNMARNQVIRGGLEIWRFTFTNTTSTNGGTSVVLAQNDTMDLAYLNVQTKLYSIKISVPVAGGAGLTLSIGRVDPNNSSNNSATRYVNALDISGATAVAAEQMLLTGDSVGVDNLGDDSIGNTPPQFGAAPIVIRATFGGAIAAAGFSLSGWLMFVPGNQG